jgi:glycosyltransferase involved in cell wall biosynthesis
LSEHIRVLALTSYPVEAAATRYRLEQFVAPLAERGIDLTIRPFLDSKLFERLYRRDALPENLFGLLRSGLQRFKDVFAAGDVDVVMVQREAMIFGPPLIEWLTARVRKRPILLDLDDATYVSYASPTYGRLGEFVKWVGKTDDLIKWASVVTCGNRAIADYVSSKGVKARVIPTVVDTDIFHPISRRRELEVVVGWVGTHSTFPYLASIFPVLEEIAKSLKFRLKVVGAGAKNIELSGVEVENLQWKLKREVQDFQSLDIGLYPIDASLYASEWAAGKSGFKAIQYMAVGIPYVATPIGGIQEIGELGKTHFFATTHEEWRKALSTLIADREMREKMGAAGRRHVIECYGLAAQADKLAMALREAAGSAGS